LFVWFPCAAAGFGRTVTQREGSAVGHGRATYQRAYILFYDMRRYDLAERELRGVLAERPNDAYSHALLSLCLIQRRQLDEAQREAEEAVRLAPDVSFAHYARARLLGARYNYRKARTAILEALRIDPRQADYFSWLAVYYYDAGHHRKALEAADKGLEIDPLHVSCINLRALALGRLGRTKEASDTLDQSLARDPVNAISHAIQGSTFLRQTEYEQALDSFMEALRLDPLCEWAHRGRRCARTGLTLMRPATAIGRALSKLLRPRRLRLKEPTYRTAAWLGAAVFVVLGAAGAGLAARDSYIAQFTLGYSSGTLGAFWTLDRLALKFRRLLQRCCAILCFFLSMCVWQAAAERFPLPKDTQAGALILTCLAIPVALAALFAFEGFLFGIADANTLAEQSMPRRKRN
jgi:tetratricopeptide (TPR) repeat protein